MVHGWVGPAGAREGVGGIWSGVISEAHSLNNQEAELCMEMVFYYEFNPFREMKERRAHMHTQYLDTLVSLPGG